MLPLDIWGHADQPITQTKLCGKVDRYLERTYHARRQTAPLKRVGAKGSGQFVPVTWDEGIERNVQRLKTIIAEHGAKSVLHLFLRRDDGVVASRRMKCRLGTKWGQAV